MVIHRINNGNVVHLRKLDSMGRAVEYRGFELSEIRAVRDKLEIEGHAAVFNRLSEDLGGFREQVSPGAFSQTISEDDIYGLFNHDPSKVLGRNRSGTLQLAEDPLGLSMHIDLPDASYARDLLVSIERRDITGASFGFVVPRGGDSWEEMEGGVALRTLLHVRLLDVSPVTYPAYPQTDVSVAKRSLDEWRTSQRPPSPMARLERRQKLAEL